MPYYLAQVDQSGMSDGIREFLSGQHASELQLDLQGTHAALKPTMDALAREKKLLQFQHHKIARANHSYPVRAGRGLA